MTLSERLNAWWHHHGSPNKHKIGAIGAMLIIALVLCIGLLTPREEGQIAGNPPPVQPQPPAPKLTKYVVQKKDFLIAVAEKKAIPWEELMLFNETTLRANAAVHCRRKSQKREYYCNPNLTYKGQPIMFANSIWPGDEWLLPEVAPSPATVADAVAKIPGNRIVVIVDGTDSMDNDRKVVASWYLQQIRASGKEVSKVLVFAEGQVREFEAGGTPVFDLTGGYENTRGAIEHARKFSPDAIVLISDEPGDDWDNFTGMEGIPPVIAHSLDPSADVNLSKVAQATGGQFLRSYNSQFASRP